MSHDPLAGFRQINIGDVITRARDGRTFVIEEVCENDFTMVLRETRQNTEYKRLKCTTVRRWVRGK